MRHDLTKYEIIRLRAENYGISYQKAKQQTEELRRKAKNQQELINIGESILSWYRRTRNWLN